MRKLDKNGQMLLEILEKQIRQIKLGDPRTYITYKEAHSLLGLNLLSGYSWGKSLQEQGLNSLADWTKENKLPGITGLIVNGAHDDNRPWQPGTGYFELFDRSREDFQWWNEEIARAKAFDWLPFIAMNVIDDSSKTASDNAGVIPDPFDDPLFSSYLASIDDTERDAVIKARICQGVFRDALIERWGGCAVTKCGLKEALIAGHIMPWSRCETAEQRLSAANGLLLTPNLDKLFDKGFISFDDNYRIIFSSQLKDGYALQLGVTKDMHLSNRAYPELIPFLRWHREHILK